MKKNDPELEKVLMIIKDLKGLFVRLFQAPTGSNIYFLTLSYNPGFYLLINVNRVHEISSFLVQCRRLRSVRNVFSLSPTVFPL